MSSRVTFHTVSEEEAGQRIDNFLMRHLKGVPKSKIYTILRKGEVRVNKKRIKPTYKLLAKDTIRIPPLRVSPKKSFESEALETLYLTVLYEDEHLITIDKPSGLAVHSGSNQQCGLIEALKRRYAHPLWLVHRLDKATSGALLIAKNRKALLSLQDLLKSKEGIKKGYLALVYGECRWQDEVLVDRLVRRNQGVEVSHAGKEARGIATTLQSNGKYSLVRIRLLTGRTHQVRVQLASRGYPIVGDRRYGDAIRDRYAKEALGQGFRMMLHAHSLTFSLFGKKYSIVAKQPRAFEALLSSSSFRLLH